MAHESHCCYGGERGAESTDSMSPESGHRFLDEDMRKDKELKHGKRI
jgi:hypothetical protein